MDRIIEQLGKMNIAYNDMKPMRVKDGVFLFRILCGPNTYVLKYFENEPDRREIENYRILNAIGVKTMRIVAHTDCSLLMEDLERSAQYRLGMESDSNDVEVARAIAKWYQTLHSNGEQYVKMYGSNLYSENDAVTPENIEHIKVKTSTQYHPVWELLHRHLDTIRARINGANRTLTYNDFHHSNLATARDKTSAFLFDYHLLGKGYAYADARNACYAMGDRAKEAFLDAYGFIDPGEAMLDDVVSVIVTLSSACRKKAFPSWAKPCLEELQSGFSRKIENLMNTAV